MHPDYQGRRIGGKLIEARWDLVRRLNLRGMVAGSIIMDYHQVADTVTPDQYVREVVDGARFDNNLTKQLKKGFKVHNLIPDYCDDPRSRNWGVAIVWENPDHLPNPKIVGRVTPPRSSTPRTRQRPPVAAQSVLRATGP